MDAVLIDQVLDVGIPDYAYTLFIYGAFKHPGDYCPRPASDGVVLVEWTVPEIIPPGGSDAVPTSPDLDTWGHVFWTAVVLSIRSKSFRVVAGVFLC